MSYIIDGHNLIGVMPDIHLSDPDDELRLLERLRAYQAARSGASRGRVPNRYGKRSPPKGEIIVFFDSGDLPAHSTDLSSPGLQVRFASPGQTADDAIVAFLRGCAQPGQYAVVTDDQELSQQVRALGASLIRASDFAARFRRGGVSPLGVPLPSPRPHASPQSPSSKPEVHPRDPAFADIYTGFIQAEKSRAHFEGESHTDPAYWVEKLRAAGSDVGEAQQAARWLGQYGGHRALGPLRDAVTHGDVRVRAAALLALGDLGDPAVLPDLCDRLVNDPGNMAREAAAQSLARIGDRSVEPLLEAVAKSDPKSKVRKAALAALAQIRARRAR